MKKVKEQIDELEIPDIEVVKKTTLDAIAKKEKIAKANLFNEIVKYNKLLIDEIDKASSVGYIQCCLSDVPHDICVELVKLYQGKKYICKYDEKRFLLSWFEN